MTTAPGACRPSNERGVALVMAVLALVVIGALVAGTFLAGRLEQRSGRNSLFASQAFEAAEAGSAETIAGWTSAALNSRPLGSDTVLPSKALGGGAEFSVTVTRLSPATFLIRSDGQRKDAAGGTLARRLVGLLVRLDPPAIDASAALTTVGPLSLAGAVSIDQADRIPAGWSACPPAGVAAGIRSAASVVVDSGPMPPVRVDTLLGAAAFRSFGTSTFDDLAAAANIQLGTSAAGLRPSLAGAGCDLYDMSNWGEPGRGPGSVAACADYFPTVYSAGDLQLTGGRGQGLLLVRGDLDLAGGVDFYGVIVVLGRLTTSGAGGRVHGAVLAGGPGSRIGVGSEVSRSSCAVQRALAGAAPARPFEERAWEQLY